MGFAARGGGGGVCVVVVGSLGFGVLPLISVKWSLFGVPWTSAGWSHDGPFSSKNIVFQWFLLPRPSVELLPWALPWTSVGMGHQSPPGRLPGLRH